MADKKKLEGPLPPMKRDYLTDTNEQIDYENGPGLNRGVSVTGMASDSLPSKAMSIFGAGAMAIPYPGKSRILVDESVFPMTATGPALAPKYNPRMLEHERVHAGQFKLRDIPSSSEAKKLLFGSEPDGDEFMQSVYGKDPTTNDAFEVPATALTHQLSTVGPQYREKMYDYLDKVYEKNPDNAALFEAYLPDRLVKQYIQDRPRPYPKTELQKKLGSW